MDQFTKYASYPILYLRRADCDPVFGAPDFLRTMGGLVPNAHPKYPQKGWRQRTPNLAVDNLCLFKYMNHIQDPKYGKICTVLGWMDKEFEAHGQKKRVTGWVLSGGHVEYDDMPMPNGRTDPADLSCTERALKELEQEFGIAPQNVVRTVPVAFVDDFLRDPRNKYATLVHLQWINAAPKPTDEHKVVMVVTLEELSKMLHEGLKKSPRPGVPEAGFALGHGGFIKEILQAPQTKQLMGDMMTAF